MTIDPGRKRLHATRALHGLNPHSSNGFDNNNNNPLLHHSVSLTRSHHQQGAGSNNLNRNNNNAVTVNSNQNQPLSFLTNIGTAWEQELLEYEMSSDGNCLFRSVSDQVYHSPDHHFLVRQKVIDYIRVERAFFEPFLDTSDTSETFEDYCNRKSQDGVWGNDIELQAISEIYDSGIEIFLPDGRLLRTFHEVGPSEGLIEDARVQSQQQSSSEEVHQTLNGVSSNFIPGGRTTIRLIYRGRSHYNSLRARETQTAGGSLQSQLSSTSNRGTSGRPLIIAVRERYMYYCGRGLLGNLDLNPTGQQERPPLSQAGEIEDLAIERRKRWRRSSEQQVVTESSMSFQEQPSSSSSSKIQNQNNQNSQQQSDDQERVALEQSRAEFQILQESQLDEAIKASLQDHQQQSSITDPGTAVAQPPAAAIGQDMDDEELELQQALAMSMGENISNSDHGSAVTPGGNNVLMGQQTGAVGGSGKEPAANVNTVTTADNNNTKASDFGTDFNLSDSVLECVSMGFSIEESRKAHEFCGDNIDEMIMFLTMNRS